MKESLTKDELRACRATLIMEWEVKAGIRWTLDGGVTVPELVEKLERMIAQ